MVTGVIDIPITRIPCPVTRRLNRGIATRAIAKIEVINETHIVGEATPLEGAVTAAT